VKGVAIMANISINIRMDADLKRQFEGFCSDMGMTMTTAFTIFARKAVREYRIPFEISGDVPNAETVEAIQEVKRMKANPNLGKTYSDVDQMMGELLADV
jgi:DNA-damage-inducible protein J